MNEMIERVARAIAQEVLRQGDFDRPVTFDSEPLTWDYIDQNNVDFGKIAGAAILAMREPTEPMKRAWNRDFQDWLDERIEDEYHPYTAMIEAALE